ncbi:hypothetical protein Tco_1010823 [Tanacetum coccineum]
MGSDDVEPKNEKPFNLEETNQDDEQEIGEIFRFETNLFDYETPLCEKFKEFNYLFKIDSDVLTSDIVGFKTYDEYKDDWIYDWHKNVPWVHEKPWTDTGVWTEPPPVVHYYGYCNGGNLPGAYIVGNTLHYQDLEWYDALKDIELKEEALRNKAIMKGLINKDVESNNKGWKIWDDFESTNDDHNEWEYKNEHEDDERYELCGNETHEFLVFNIRRFEMIKYSFGTEKSMLLLKKNELRRDLASKRRCMPSIPRNLSHDGRRMDGNMNLMKKSERKKSS